MRCAISRSARGVHVDVAVARRGVDHRDGGHRLERLLQALAAAGDDQVHQPVLGGQLRELLAPAARHQRTTRARQGSAPAAMPASTALECAADEEPRSTMALPAFRRQRRGIDRDVGPGLVDHRDHAERDAHPAHVEPVGQPAARPRPPPRGRAARRSRARRRPSPRPAPRPAAGGRAARRPAPPPAPPPCRGRSPRGSPESAPPSASAIASSAASLDAESSRASPRAAALGGERRCR